MADSDRVHEPSPVHLLRAKEDGIVIRSAELSRSLTFCFVAGTLLIFSAASEQLFGGYLESSLGAVQIKTSAIDASRQSTDLVKLLFPIGICLASIVLLAIGTWHFQSPLAPHFRKTSPDLTRLSPWTTLCRMFSIDTFVRIGMSLLLLGALLTVAVLVLLSQSERIVAGMTGGLRMNLQVAGEFLRNVLMATGCLIILFGLADYVRERLKIGARLKMTDQERRDEARENEINPQFRRQILR